MDKQDSYCRVIQPGKVLVDHGPVTMTIQAGLQGQPFTKAAEAGAGLVPHLLAELVRYLSIARLAVGDLDPAKDSDYPVVLRRMAGSVRMLGEADFTPMAAVAGTFSDLVKEAVVAAGSDRVVVNNGGDIALHLGCGCVPFRVGIISDLAEGRVTHVFDIHPGMGVGGIATSGLGGRSLTKGVASAVTVVAENGSLADAAATAIANAADCDHPSVERCLAEELDHLTDIRGHLVTRRVGILPRAAVEKALSGGLERARQLCRQGMIMGAVIFVQGRAVMWPDNLVSPLFRHTGF
ncbi:MAG: UPF0280 family protein [Peptococcaceae bacterium]|nr:UPF0280 family protein [Peptococcaceae bacterium]